MRNMAILCVILCLFVVGNAQEKDKEKLSVAIFYANKIDKDSVGVLLVKNIIETIYYSSSMKVWEWQGERYDVALHIRTLELKDVECLYGVSLYAVFIEMNSYSDFAIGYCNQDSITDIVNHLFVRIDNFIGRVRKHQSDKDKKEQ